MESFKTAILEPNRELYVHQMLTGYRTDVIPFCKCILRVGFGLSLITMLNFSLFDLDANPRHVRHVEREKYKSKNVFDAVMYQDTTENNF